MNEGSSKWFRVAGVEAIPAREGRAVEVASKQLAIFNLGDRFVAVENKCPHRSGPLADGILAGNTIVCPLHTWKFDLATGNSVNHAESGLCLRLFTVKVDGDVICVQLPQVGEEAGDAVPNCEIPDRPLRWVARKPLTSIMPL